MLMKSAAAVMLLAAPVLAQQAAQSAKVPMAKIYEHAATKDRVTRGPQGMPLSRAWKARVKPNAAAVKLPNSYKAVTDFYRGFFAGVEGATVYESADKKAFTVTFADASDARKTIHAQVSGTAGGSQLEVVSATTAEAVTITGRPQRPTVEIIIKRASIDEVFSSEKWFESRLKDYEPQVFRKAP